MLTSFLGRLFFGPTARPTRRVSKSLAPRGAVPALEGRTLLAGNVTAAIVDGVLQVTGDDADNDIRIIETADGVIVRGQNTTTINGAATDFVAFAAALDANGPIEIRMGAGNDAVQVNDFQLNGTLYVEGGAGDDRLGLTGMTFDQSVEFVGGAGNDTLFAEGSEFQRLVARTGAGDDLVTLTDCDITGSLVMAGASGDDRLALDSTTVGRRTRALMNQGDDDVLLTNGTQTKHVYIWGGRGDDLVQVNDSDTSKSFVARMWHGDDAVSFEGDVDVEKRLLIRARGDNDSFDNGTGTLPEDARLIDIEAETVPADLLTERITSPTTGLLAAIADLRELFLPLAVTVTGTGLVQSSGLQITPNAAVTVNVTGAAGSTVEMDIDGDGFDDGTATIGTNGTGTITATLTHTDANQGLNTIRVRQSQGGTPIGTTESVRVHFATGRVVRMATTEGNVDIELFNTDAPDTVANFLTYLARYEGSIVHRSAKSGTGGDFIIQGGGFDFVPPVQEITKNTETLDHEFLAENSNVRGTLSMALPSSGTPGSGGTSEWFINTANNAFLDANLHTVFGRVVGDGMTVVDAIHDLTSFNIAAATDLGALTDTPLKGGYTAFTGTLTGTVSTTTGSTAVTGTGTLFTTDLVVGAAFRVNGQVFTVASIQSNTALTLRANATATNTNAAAQVSVAPTDTQYVRINTVTTIANG